MVKAVFYALLIAVTFSGAGNAQAIVESCGFSGPHKDPCVLTISQEGARETYEILRPIVDREQAVYERITFRAGDQVTVQAGGCVQTGGVGRTWKRYVNPSGPNSSRLYSRESKFAKFPLPQACLL